MKKNKTVYRATTAIITFLMTISISNVYSQTNNLKTKKMNTDQTRKQSETTQQVLIDQFFVPKNAKQEFDERMKLSRDFIIKLPGFIEDNVYERTDENGDFICITMASWENEEVIKNAKQAVQAEYKREGFDMQGMLKRLNITIERGIYNKIK